MELNSQEVLLVLYIFLVSMKVTSKIPQPPAL